MAEPSIDLILEITDRLAKQYEMLLDFQQQISDPGQKASLTVVTGALTSLTYRAIKPGSFYNYFSITYRDPGLANQELSVEADSGNTVNGQLGVGTYILRYTDVTDAGETLPSPSATFEIKSGDIAYVTLPARPIGVKSRNLYLTVAGGAAGSEKLFLTNLITVDAVLDLFNEGAGSGVPQFNTAEFDDPTQAPVVYIPQTDIIINLATDGGGTITTTANDIFNLLNTNAFLPFFEHLSIRKNDAGTGVVTAFSKTFLTGGTHGLITPKILATEDPQIISDMLATSQELDHSLTADLIVNDIPLWSAFISGIS